MSESSAGAAPGRRLDRAEALGRLGLLAASCLTAAVAAEIGVRIYDASFACHRERPDPSGLYLDDPLYGHRLSPGYVGRMDGGCWETPVRVNSRGMRGGEAGGKPAGARRILLAGDSYVFGLGVAEEASLARALERSLGSVAPSPGGAPAGGDRDGRSTRAEVLNAGVPGWTSVQAARLIEDQAPALEADEALVVIYLGNDVEERVRFEERSLQPKGPAAAASRQGASFQDRFLASRLLRLVEDRWSEAAFKAGARRRPPERPWFDIFRKEEPDRVAEGYRLMREDLVEAARFCAGAEIPLRAVLAPAWPQTVHAAAGSLCRAYDCEAREMDMRLPNARLRAILDEAGIPSLDLTETMEEAFAEKRFRFVYGHWDERGTSIAADAIAGWLRAQGVP